MTDMSSTRSGGGAAAARARRGHKERSKNFTELEKRTVLELIARHRDVLRQGRSNNATNRSKQLVWSSICEEVNARCGGERPRTAAQVKMWYENYKKKCKMRAHDQPARAADPPSLLDGMLWQNIHPLDLKDEEGPASVASGSCKDDGPLNMSNGRSSAQDSDETMTTLLEPHVQILPASPPSPCPCPPSPSPRSPAPPPPPLALEQARFLQRLNELTNTPLNLSHLDENGSSRASPPAPAPAPAPPPPPPRPGPTDEERRYFSAKRQHAVWEHEAKMKILNMELRQKEEIFSLQKQLFLIELRLKMDFLEKAGAK